MEYGASVLTKFGLRFGCGYVEVQLREQSFNGYFQVESLTLRHRLFGGGWSPPLRREIFHRGDSVAILPWDPVIDELVLVEQFRVGALRAKESPWMLELIAGVVEPGESDIDVIHREVDEEAGCKVGRLKKIGTFYPSGGACSEQIRVFVGLVKGVQPGSIHGLESEHEDILVHQLPRIEALAMLDRGEIKSGHTLLALHWLARHGDRLREELQSLADV